MFRRIVKIIEEHQTTSTLIFASIAGLLGFLVSLLVSPLERTDILSAVSKTVAYLGASVPLSRWVFGLLVMAALVGSAFLGWPLINRFQQLREEKPAPPPPSDSYREAKIRDILWRWIWAGGEVYNLTAYCPECDLKLNWKAAQSGVAALGGYFACKRCKERRTNHEIREEFRITISEEIQRRARVLDRGEKLPSG